MNRESVTKQLFRKERALRLTGALRGALMFLAGIACGVPALSGNRRFITLFAAAIFLVLSATGLFLLLYALYRLPASKSVFGRSILFQSRGGKSLSALCAEIDKDLAKAPSFGPVTVGARWMILGNQALRLSQICGIFTIKASREKRALCVADVDGNIVQITRMEASQAAMITAHLHRLLPRAATGDFEACQTFLDLPPEQRKKHRFIPEPDLHGWDPATHLAFWGLDDIPTSLFTPESVAETFWAMPPGGSVGLTLIGPVEREDEAAGLFAARDSAGVYSLEIPFMDGGLPAKAARTVEADGALEALSALLETGRLPDFSAWDRPDWRQAQAQPLELHADGEIYRHNTGADVALVLDWLEEKNCASFALMRPDRSSGGLFVNRIPEGYRVLAAVPDGDDVRWMETVTKRMDQIRFWVNGYYTSLAFPYLSGWEDITKKMGGKL